MIAFPDMLVSAAEKAGMNVPENPDKYDRGKSICTSLYSVQCSWGKFVRYHGEHWENAEVIADISDNEIKTVTLCNLMDKGFIY